MNLDMFFRYLGVNITETDMERACCNVLMDPAPGYWNEVKWMNGSEDDIEPASLTLASTVQKLIPSNKEWAEITPLKILGLKEDGHLCRAITCGSHTIFARLSTHYTANGIMHNLDAVIVKEQP